MPHQKRGQQKSRKQPESGILLKHKILISISAGILILLFILGTVTSMAIRQIEEQIAKSNRASLLVYYNTLRDEITGTEIFMTEKVHSQETKKRILESFAEELSNNPDVAAYMLYDTAKRESDSV